MTANETIDRTGGPCEEPLVSGTIRPEAAIRERLSRAGVTAVRLVGPPGSGKTTLIEETAWQLRGRLRVGAIVANPAAKRDAERLWRYVDQVQAVDCAVLSAQAVLSALQRIDLSEVDVLLIESCGGIGPFPDVGQDLTVAVLSVSGGDDKAAEYGHLVQAATAVALTKTDLRPSVSFDLNLFRGDVARLQPQATVFEMAAFEGKGMTPWLGWIEEKVAAQRRNAAAKAQKTAPEWFFG